MITKTGDLREDSVGDFFTNKKATHFEKNGFVAANKSDVEELQAAEPKEKTAFEKLETAE